MSITHEYKKLLIENLYSYEVELNTNVLTKRNEDKDLPFELFSVSCDSDIQTIANNS